MEKYIGNKSSLLPVIETFVRTQIPNARTLSDLFAGTTNVSRYFRARGWRTAACDANRFSYVLARAYLGVTEPPLFEGIPIHDIGPLGVARVKQEFERANNRFGALYLPGMDWQVVFEKLEPMARALVWLQELGKQNQQPGVFTEYFTKWGSSSQYVSLRGTSGSRNYFSLPNALFLDGALGVIRSCWRDGRLSLEESLLLLTSIIEETVITANVSGTFHDFNRDRLWPNAHQPFFLRLPLIYCGGTPSELANSDVFGAAAAFGNHDVCYLDPPYNFRQYSAYYHLLNFIAAFPFLEDVEAYVEKLTHVRGQHPEDDFSSDFCFRDRFVASLRRLVESVDAQHIVLSYYGGRNHWNHWSKVGIPTDQGLREIRALFEDEILFSHREVVPALEIRKNYQSRVGEQKGLVNEYLFHGVRRPGRRRVPATNQLSLEANRLLGIEDAFSHVAPAQAVTAPLRRAIG